MKYFITTTTLLLTFFMAIGQGNTILNLNKEWLSTLNDDLPSIDQFYHTEAISIASDGTIYDTPPARMTYLESLKRNAAFVDVSTIKTIQGNDNITYELGDLVSNRGKRMMFLVIWNNKEGQVKRELEIFYRTDKRNPDITEIDAAREKWMKLCNAHNSFELVKNSYAADALYYNHKPLVIGTEAIAEEYSYMNQPNYSLKLSPIIVEKVNKKIVFEIGQCSGSYNGRYVLVWKKGKKGEWKVFFDSNI